VFPLSNYSPDNTFVWLFSSIGQSRDLFRVTGALSYVLDLLYNTGSTRLQQATLYTLGCATEKNGMTQKMNIYNYWDLTFTLHYPANTTIYWTLPSK
jgi:hypothetical protein